jgi:hypothetical protein
MPPLPHWSGQLQLEPRQGYKIPCFLSHLILYIQPLKMGLTQGSETSANYNLTPGKYPKEQIQNVNSVIYKMCTVLYINTVHILNIVLFTSVHKYVLVFNLYFNIYHRLCYILNLYELWVTCAPKEGDVLWQKHVKITLTYELVREVGNKFTSASLMQERCVIINLKFIVTAVIIIHIGNSTKQVL